MLHLNTTYLAQKGSPNKILRAAGASNTTASNLQKATIRSFDFRVLTALCLQLNCTPNDLLTYTPPTKAKLPQDHALTQLLPTNQINIIQALPTLTKAQIQQIQQIITPNK